MFISQIAFSKTLYIVISSEPTPLRQSYACCAGAQHGERRREASREICFE